MPERRTPPSRDRMAESKEPTERKYAPLEETHRFTHPRRRKKERPPGGGDFLVDILTLPVLGAPRMAHWLGKKLVETAEQEEFDEGALQGQLLDLQMRYELGEVSEEEYTQQETALLERLRVIREAKSA